MGKCTDAATGSGADTGNAPVSSRCTLGASGMWSPSADAALDASSASSSRSVSNSASKSNPELSPVTIPSASNASVTPATLSCMSEIESASSSASARSCSGFPIAPMVLAMWAFMVAVASAMSRTTSV